MKSNSKKSKTGERGTAARPASGIEVVHFNFSACLKKITGIDGWKAATGPDSRVGVDYWYRAEKHDAYINIDQGAMTISVDGDVVFEGSADEAVCTGGKPS